MVCRRAMQTDLGERLRQADIDALLDKVSGCEGITVNISGCEPLVCHVKEDKVLLGLQYAGIVSVLLAV